MLKRFAAEKPVSLVWSTGRGVFVLALICAVLAPCLCFPAEFDSRDWKSFREVVIPPDVSEGVIGVAVESSVIVRSRPDLADLRLVASTGELVPVTITQPVREAAPPPFSTLISKVIQRPGKGTDILVDKKGKILSRGITIGTKSQNFLRKVELRGSDAPTESFVIRMDGLIFDIPGPVPVRSLDLFHPVNNFRYLHIRIIDDDQPPVKVDSILCHPPVPRLFSDVKTDARIVENRKSGPDNASFVIVDLGEKRYPVSGLTLSTPTEQFVKKVRLSGGSSSSPESWQTFHEGKVFRVRQEEAMKESLGLAFEPQTYRYLALEITGQGRALDVSSVQATPAVRLVIFPFHPGLTYRLYYHNPDAKPLPPTAPAQSISVNKLLEAAGRFSLGEEQKNLAPTPPRTATAQKKEIAPPTFWKLFGMGMLLVGLLLMFTLMLRSRAARRSDRGRRSRIIQTKI